VRYKIFTKTNCPGCDALKARLNKAGLLESVSIEMIGPSNIDFIKSLGARSAPAIVDSKTSSIISEQELVNSLL
jgi:glutaredoxin